MGLVAKIWYKFYFSPWNLSQKKLTPQIKDSLVLQPPIAMWHQISSLSLSSLSLSLSLSLPSNEAPENIMVWIWKPACVRGKRLKIEWVIVTVELKWAPDMRINHNHDNQTPYYTTLWKCYWPIYLIDNNQTTPSKD